MGLTFCREFATRLPLTCRVPPELAATASALPPPVPDHVLDRVIGRGAYGDVWLAHSALGTARAVKIVGRERFEHARPFEREFEAVEKVEPLSRQHPGLVDILQVGRIEDGAAFYYVMELADGAGAAPYSPRTLRSELASRGRLPVTKVAEIGARLADGLKFLHDHGLVHRDLKPANILFIGGEPKLGDIGLVAAIGRGDGERSFVGTEGYIAPEGPGSPAADVFALGLVLYEAATGLSRHDFPQVPATLAASEEAEDFAELNAILLRACELKADRRYVSVAAMQRDLHALAQGRSVRQLRELERRFRRVRVALAVFGLFCLVTGLGAWWLHRQTTAARAEAARESQHATELAGKERELRIHLYAADMREAGEAARAGNLGRARDVLARWDSEDVRDGAWSFLSEAARGDTHRVLTGHARNVAGLALSPDGRSIFSCGFDGTVRVWDPVEGTGRTIAEKTGEPFYEIECLGDGATVLLGGGTAAWRFDLPTAKWTRLADGAARYIAAPATGNWAAFGGKTQFFGDDEPVEIVPLSDAGQGKVLTERSGRVAVSFDGSLLATGDVDGVCTIYHTSGWQPMHALKSFGQISALAFSPDYRFLAAGLREGGVVVWNVATGEVEFRQAAHDRQVVWCVAWSSDGKFLASGGSDQSVHLWEAPARRLHRVLRGHEDEVWSVLFARDGTWLASSGKDETIRVWPLAASPATNLPDQLAGRPVFSPDGRWVSCVQRDAPLPIFDAATFARVGELPESEVPLAFERDGEILLSSPRGHTLNRWKWRSGEKQGSVTLADAGSRGDRWALSPDRRWLAMTLADGALAIWSAETGKLVFRESGGLHELAFSPDSRWLATSHNDFSIQLRRAEDWAAVTAIPAHKMRSAGLAFSPDSRILASASWDGTAATWDVATGGRRLGFRGHTTSLQDVVFLPGGNLLAILEGDASIAFWDLRSQRASARLPAALTDSNHNLAVSPDGQTLLSTKLSGSRPGVWRAAQKPR